MKVKMKKDAIGRQGLVGYKSELFEKGKAYDITDSLGKIFISEELAEKTRAKPEKETKPKKAVENKADLPEENK